MMTVALALYTFWAGALASVLILGIWVVLVDDEDPETRKRTFQVAMVVPLVVLTWPLFVVLMLAVHLTRARSAR